MPVNMQDVHEWVRKADAIFNTPLVRLTVVPILKAMLPPMGVTPEQVATLDAHYADLETREREAKRRSTDAALR